MDTITLIGQDEYREIERDIFINPDKIHEAITSTAPLAGKVDAQDQKPDVQEVPFIEINDGVLSVSVHFNFDSDVIWKSSYEHLDRIVNLLKSTPVNIILAGHTDNTGPENYNLTLSEKRAMSVHKYFVEKGIDAEKIRTIGYGESRPLTSNATKDGRRRNRRVEFIRADEMEKYNQKYQQ